MRLRGKMSNNQSNTPLISVIIPAYKVEKYLAFCVESVVAQTLASYEVIIVDDGSPDNTGEIADHLAQQYETVKVIHQENAGVSTARNTGIDNAQGKYITFIDGDDFIAPTFLEYMVNMVEKTHSDFGLALDCFTKNDEKPLDQTEDKVYAPEKAVSLLLSPRVIVGCWNKVYRRDFLVEKSLKFRTDLFYGEGLYFITMAAEAANHVVVTNYKGYYYRRNNYASATSKFKIDSVYNGEKSINEIERDLPRKTKSIEMMPILHRSMYSIGAITKLIQNHVVSDYRTDYRRWLKYIRSNILKILLSNEVSMYRKGLLLGGCISLSVMEKLNEVRRRRISSASVDKQTLKNNNEIEEK